MERSDWLKARRQISVERFDTLWAPVYDDEWGATIAPTHQRMYARFLETCPPGGWILEAACGTGKYWPLILDSGRVVFGLDQSQGMLDRAKAKFPQVPVAKLGLQEMRFWGAFDGASCMDAMECVFPEDWPLVLDNFYRALKTGGVFYFTVELAAEQDIQEAYEAGITLGLPLVVGEWMEGEGYHYYPRIPQVKEWLALANFSLIEEVVGDEYHHFLVQKQVEMG